LSRFRWILVGVGGIVLAFGLGGGWWIATRAIRPISKISATAERIATGDLTQRIPIGESGNELGRLTQVLNSTFAKLDAAFARQKQFTADAAHELRTPVSVMLTHAQNGLANDSTGEEQREALEACQRAAQRMRRLIESLLELARLDGNQDSAPPITFDFSQMVSECVDHIQPLAADLGVKIQCELLPSPCTGQRERLAQVVTNLLTNAIQYNKPAGEVQVSVQSQSQALIMTVSDTGIGIAAEQLPYVFDRFYRVNAARTSAKGHAGLGLAISKAIIEAHGGTIEVSSQPGTGSTFTVRLPATILSSSV
jgi:heavy metal sensor kinase